MIPEKMKAVVMTDVREMEWHEYDVPKMAINEVLIKMERSAICTIDQRAYTSVSKGNFPRVAGHEGAGVVVAVGDLIQTVKVGDRVAIGKNRCGACVNCILQNGPCTSFPPVDDAGLRTSIETPFLLNGTFAQYIVRKETEIFKVDDSISTVHAALTEPFSAVIRSIRLSRLELGETCVIYGAGIMGILHTQMARNVGARVIVIEVDPARCEQAKKAGADIVINPKECDPLQTVMDITKGRGAEVVFFAIPVSSVFPQAFSMVSRAGRIVIYSNQHPDEPYPLKLGQLHRNTRQIIGVNGATPNEFLTALRMMEFGKVDMDLVISQSFPVTKCKEAFEAAIVPCTYRVIINMDEE